MNLLIVEDNPVNRKLLRAQLEAEGHEVLDATNGLEALEILDRERVDGVVSDILMPDMDGYRLCLEIRKKKATSGLPFIFYTSTYSSPQDQKLAKTVGADDYISKPAPTPVLLEALNKAMQKTRPRIAQSAAKHDESYVLRQYNASLVNKLEQRNTELEQVVDQLQNTHLKLQASERQLQLFVYHAPAAIAMLDLNLRYVAVSRRWMSDYRLGDRSIIGLGHYEVFPEIPDRWKEIHQRCLAGAVEKCNEDTFHRKDGTVDWERWEIHPWHTDSGKIGGIILFTESITERKKTRAALIQSEERFRAIFDHAGVGISMRPAHDRKHPWVQVNDLFCEMLGYSRDELLKLSTADITPKDHEADAVEDNARLLKGEITRYSREKQIVRKDGQRIWVLLTVAVLPGPDGRAENLIATYQNITERKEAEDRIRRLSRMRAVSSDTNAAIARISDRQDLFETICRIAVKQGELGFAWIGSLDPATLDIRPGAWYGEVSDELRTATSTAHDRPPRGQGAVSRAIRERRTIVNNNLAERSHVGPRRDAALRQGFHSMIALPLFEGEAVVGTFTLYAREPEYFDEDEIALLTELAGNVSFALEHMARQEKIAKLTRIRSVLGKINAAIVRVHDRQALLDEACRIAAEAGGFSFAWIGTYEREAKQVRPISWAGAADDYLDTVRAPRPVDDTARSKGLVATAVLDRTTAIINDARNDPRMTRREMHLQRGTRSIAVLPLSVSGEVSGVLVLHAREAGFFDDEELQLLHELASDIGFALQTIEKQEKLDYISYYDPLTGLPNRTLFMDRAGQQMRARSGEPLTVAMALINIERFRNINETYGRHGGDELLRGVAQRLESAFKGKDYLSRIGADGFGIVIRGIMDSAKIMHAIEDQILGCFREPFKVSGDELRAAARIGVAVFPADGREADRLYRNAEAALKMAKESGERYMFYAAEMNARAAQILSLESKLRRAVETREFVLHYQPKYRLADGKICGMEALIRWQDPANGLVAPGIFMPLLEETGLILEVGKWAMDRALAQHRAWTAQGLEVPRIAVNVSPIQLQQKNFSRMVITAVQEQGDNAEALELEVTESLLMKDVQASIRTLSILRGMGITIAMDDFGTGYSSLAYLARLPINSIKIDRAFVNGMTSSPQDLGIVTTIVGLAHSMNLKVVAEGVETGEQLQFLKELACDEAQGFLFSKPLPAEQIESLLLPDKRG